MEYDSYPSFIKLYIMVFLLIPKHRGQETRKLHQEMIFLNILIMLNLFDYDNFMQRLHLGNGVMGFNALKPSISHSLLMFNKVKSLKFIP